MKNLKKKICILIAVLTMLALSGACVFAETQSDEMLAQDEAVVTEPSGTVEGGTTDPSDPTDPTGGADPTDQTDPTDPTDPTVKTEVDLATVTIDPIAKMTWTGKERKAKPLVTYTDAEGNVYELEKDVHYTVTYENNINVGKATAIITAVEGNELTGADGTVYTFIGTNSKTFKIVAPKVEKVKNVKVLSGYGAFKVTWDKSPDADYYYIERRIGNSNKGFRNRVTDAKETKTCTWENAYKVKAKTKYTFTVYAVKDSKHTGKKSHDTAARLKKSVKQGKNLGYDFISKGVKSAKTQTVRTMYINVKMKSTIGSLKAGKTYKATGYGSGQYKIPYGSHTYSIARIKVYGQKAVYQKNGKYSRDSVEFFMNGGTSWAKGKEYSYIKKKGFSTSKSYFVWVNTYNQHAYVMKKSGSKWECVDDWKVSMGTASTPSPTGTKTIIKFRAHHPGHGAPNWNFISWSNSLQHGTALHGLESGWASKLGTLASHGCIRNPSEKASAIHYKYGGDGSKVVIY